MSKREKVIEKQKMQNYISSCTITKNDAYHTFNNIQMGE